jgi:hypothetical protein
MTDEVEKIWKESTVAYSQYYHGIGLAGKSKSMQDLAGGPVRDLNPEPPKYECKALPLLQPAW